MLITITFNVFSTGFNDYVTIYDGPDNTYPVLGVYSGTNLPPQIVSSGCITIGFVSDQNIVKKDLNYLGDRCIYSVSTNNKFTSCPICSTTILNIELNQLIHCDSVSSSIINMGSNKSECNLYSCKLFE